MGFRKRGQVKRSPGRAGTGCRSKQLKQLKEELGLSAPSSNQHHPNNIPLLKPQRRNVII